MRLGVCYYPEHWPEAMWKDDAARMKALGIDRVRIAEFAWSRIEPSPGEYNWAWLDRAIDVLADAGLKVVMCTPTATPPKWLIDRHPDILPVGADGRPRAFGSRRHYDFSSPSYFEASQKICTAVAERYGKHPAVAFWQTDNEFGCHNTVVSYSPAALQRFRGWLKHRYGTIDALNTAWGTVFWSMEFRSFDEIDLPVGTVTEAHPTHRLDYRRFASDEVVRYNRMQTEIIRAHSPQRPVAHNFMQLFTEFDHYKVAADLDIATWDSYPLGALEEQWFDPSIKSKWLRTGHPDFASFNHDVYRGMSKLPFWVMEQQPGPVNWAHWNPAPLPGMVRLWSWEAFAHGAGCVSYFRWRQAPFAQEQMHSGINAPDDRLTAGGYEIGRVAAELADFDRTAVGWTGPAQVAVLFDYPADWMVQIQRHGADFDYQKIVFEWYSCLRAMGLDVDILPVSADLTGYRLVLAPTLPVVPESLVAQIKAGDAHWLFGPRTGSKTPDFAIPATLPPGPLQSVLALRVAQSESLRPSLRPRVTLDGVEGQGLCWRDHVEAGEGVEVEARFDDGVPALVRSGRVRLATACFDPVLLRAVIARSVREAGIDVVSLPDGVRLRRLGRVCFAFNYGDEVWHAAVPDGTRFLLGGAELGAAEVAAWVETA